MRTWAINCLCAWGWRIPGADDFCLLIWENSRQNRTIQSLGVSKGHGVLRKGEEKPKDFWCHCVFLVTAPFFTNPNSPIPMCRLSIHPNMEMALFLEPNYHFTLWLCLQLPPVYDLADWQHLSTQEVCLHGKPFHISLFWLVTSLNGKWQERTSEQVV